jgi:AI-2 transport protein TqsA
MTPIESTHSRPQRMTATALSLGILAVIAVGAVLKSAQAVVIPLLIAWLLSYLLAPPMNFLVRRLRFPAPLAVACIVMLLLLASWGAGIVIQQRLLGFAKAFPEYQGRLAALLAHYGKLLDIPGFAFKEADWTAQLGPLVLKTSRFFITFISNAVLVLIFLVFMLLAKPYANDKLRAAFSPERAKVIIDVTNTISRQIGAYLGALFVISLVTGLCVWGALAWIGVEFAFTWGLLAFVLNFIPTIGSIIASLPPVLMALAQHAPDIWPAAVAAAALLSIHMLFGNIIAPKVYGDRLNLSPVVILLFLVFWGWLWGIVGALLAVPIAAAIQIALSQIPALAPLAVLMGSGKKYARKSPASPPSAEA